MDKESAEISEKKLISEVDKESAEIAEFRLYFLGGDVFVSDQPKFKILVWEQ